MTEQNRMTQYVAYYRVSTATQGRSGLGLAAQKAQLLDFVGEGDEIIADFIEVQSGKLDTRVELWKAIAHAKRHSAKILIAKLDRFSRKVSFIAGIMEQGIGLVVVDMPHATDFQLHIFAALAQEERRLISDRTRKALAEAKKRGVRLGENGAVLAIRNRQNAINHARLLEPIVRPLINRELSYSAIARHLNELGILSFKGGKFYPETAKNVVVKIKL
jgi:DNA invertase Pin-like site-specific DNA recombinase